MATGSGKTVALAHLASLAANRSPALGALQQHIPFLIHASDLGLPLNDDRDTLKAIVEVGDAFAPVWDLSRYPDFVQQAFRSGRALLLLDGFDELSPEGQISTSKYLETLLRLYPKTRVVTTGSPENLDGLIALNFAPLPLRAWTGSMIDAFILCWSELWSRFVSVEAWAQGGLEQVDPLLLNTWLGSGNQALTPLELTLKLWAAYAGDGIGPDVLDAVSTHIRRLAPANTPLAALDTLALQVVVNSQPVFDPRRASEWVSRFEVSEAGAPANEAAEVPAPGKGRKEKKGEKAASVSAPSFGLLSRMAGSGLLITDLHNRMRFAHPVFEGYLAGRAMSEYDANEAILGQSDWVGKVLSLRYLAAHTDMSPLVDRVIEWSRLPMHRPLLLAARWLRDAPADASWRGKLMSALVNLLNAEGLPLGLRGQAMAGCVLSGDPAVATLFRQSMRTLSFELVQLCALASGALRDAKSIKTLESMLAAPSMSARQAACLALVAIGTPEALEVVAHSLLEGDDELRRAAAEALANDPHEGHAMLKDGASLPNILVRRAVVYGLERVDEPWAVDLLQHMQVEDEQWVVRNAAAGALEQRIQMSARAPRPLTAPAETPWLIEFAGSQHMGISPGTPATDLLLSALKSDDPEVRLAAVPYLKREAGEGTVVQLYHSMYSEDSGLREAIYLALMEIAASGRKLPHPSQFGIQ